MKITYITEAKNPFGSYKNKISDDERKKEVRDNTSKIIYDKIKDEIDKEVKDLLSALFNKTSGYSSITSNIHLCNPHKFIYCKNKGNNFILYFSNSLIGVQGYTSASASVGCVLHLSTTSIVRDGIFLKLLCEEIEKTHKDDNIKVDYHLVSDNNSIPLTEINYAIANPKIEDHILRNIKELPEAKFLIDNLDRFEGEDKSNPTINEMLDRMYESDGETKYKLTGTPAIMLNNFFGFKTDDCPLFKVLKDCKGIPFIKCCPWDYNYFSPEAKVMSICNDIIKAGAKKNFADYILDGGKVMMFKQGISGPKGAVHVRDKGFLFDEFFNIIKKDLKPENILLCVADSQYVNDPNVTAHTNEDITEDDKDGKLQLMVIEAFVDEDSGEELIQFTYVRNKD